MPSQPKPQQHSADAGAADAEGGSPVSKSTKDAMAAALARKQAGGQSHGSHLDSGAKVNDATENHKATRTFRRKSV